MSDNLGEAQCQMKGSPNSRARRRRISITRPLAFIDLETTGSILGLDRIVEVGVLKILPDGEELEFNTRVNPEMGITTEATKIHGITNRDVEDAPAFGAVAGRFSDFVDSSDLAGYNLLNFDLPMLQSEFKRVGRVMSTRGPHVIDALDIFVQKEPRDLKSAYRFYCGREYESAHLASADARACWDVLQGQISMYKDVPATPEELSSFIAEHRKKRALDSGGWFIARYGKPALARGKHQGMLIREVEEVDPNYLDWMLSIGLPNDTVEVIRSVLPNFGR